MEVLQCDGCDFRAESYDELKSHIQEVHTAFVQPADADEDSVMEEDEDEAEEQDKDDTDYVPPKSAPSPKVNTSNHTPPKPTAESLLPFFQCKFCVRYFRSKSFLKNHTKKVHNITEDESDSSESSDTTTQPKLTTHNDHSKVYPCQSCTYKTPRKARLLKHQMMYHNKEANSDYVESSGTKGTFACEWCTYKTVQKDRWTDHVVKEHSDKVNIVSFPTDLETEAVSPKLHASSSGNSPSMTTPEDTLGQTSDKKLEKPIVEISSFQYAQMSAATPNSTGTSILSQKFASSSDASKSISEIDHEEESQSSLDDDDDDDNEELGDTDDPSYTGTLSADVKLLLSEEDNKLMETKGIPFRKYMNRFQCPFCSFLTMHRRSISRHIENIHVSGKATVYKCDECPFVCTSPLKLGTHKQTHNSSDMDTLDLTGESPEHANDSGTEPVNGSNSNAKVNGKKSSSSSTSSDPQNPHRCSLCSFSTTTLKGLRVHQQHKHSYCDDLDTTAYEGQLSDQHDESNSSPILVQKAQTSILGLATKKPLVTGKRARKSINDLPLDLSSVKKRTRIDEIASNLQSKISQSQQDLVINLDDLDDEDNHSNADVEGSNHDGNHVFAYNTHQLQAHDLAFTHESGRIGKRKSNPKSKSKSIPLSLTLSDDSENMSAHPVDSRDTGHDSTDFTDDSGNTRFYCKHCDYHNKSARSVSTHYQRMHPYIKFSFKYILDPEDQSAVFRCLECYIEYNNYNDLHQHYMDHHPEASNVLNFNQPNLVYMCRFCSYTSPNVRSLMPHYQRMHPTVKINNAMIFSSYVVEQSHKTTSESQTLREILNSGPKSFNSSSSNARSSPVVKAVSKTPDLTDTEALTEVGSSNVVVYDCDVCSFASPNMHSVLVHYQKKHPEQKASYFRIQKNMKVISVDQSQPAVTSFNVSVASTPKTSSSSTAAAVASYGADEDMFYCKHCVYSNRSVVGVLVHYQKRHPEVKVTAKYIKNGPPTAGLMKLMDELQIAAPKQFLKQIQNSIQEESSPKACSGEKGEDELFFCQHCDYGNRSVKGVLIHYQKKHKETKASADMVRRHTAVVRSQRERAQMVQSSSVSAAVVPSQPDNEAGVPLRSLKCRNCSYTSPYVYALKKHLKKEHPTVKATAMTILHWAYQDGILEAGYHCEWCIYSHAEPQGLLVHYQKRHPEHNVDYAYMASKLWAGPETIQTGSNVENKHYKCKDCAFEACTTWDITSHYQAIHPWVIKADESVLLDIIKGNESTDNSQQSLPKDHPSFDCQPIEDDAPLLMATPPRDTHAVHPRLSISNNTYQCTVCLSEYNSLHGLLTHYGKKHPGMKVKAADFAQEADINPSSVYKCRHCPYVNSRIHGVLTHYQKRHPQVKVTAEDFADDIEQISDIIDVDDKCKTQRQGFGAYRCKMCSYTHGTLEKLKIHYEKYHNQSVLDIFSPSFTHFTSREAEPVAECSASNSASVSQVQDVNELDLHGISGISQLPVNKPEKHAVFKCQLCKYFCSTRKGIARHYRIKHNNVRAQPEGKNNVFKCALCSYTNPIRKGLAAHYQKRHDIDAYYTHCLAASKTMTDKPNKVPPPPPPEPDNAEMAEDIRLAVEQRKCSLCPFQAFSKKSIVSHYIKRHPGVFPKKQPGSKLGRYFTIIYAKENENNAGGEEEQKEGIEEKMDHEPDKDEDLLPFKCLKCFRLSFSRGELLSMHYNDHHRNDLKRDFGVSSPGPGEEDELYQCSHCELSFLTLETLAKHLITHNEDFQKRAMRQERRRQLLNRQKSTEMTDAKVEKESSVSKAPIGFRCNFCVEVHTTLRAICNHLRKHVQYGEAKEGHVKQEVSEVPLTMPLESLTNGDVEEEAPDTNDLHAEMSPALIPPSPAEVSGPEEDPQTGAIGGRAAALVAAARAVASGVKQRLGVAGHPCAQCDRVFMSMQGLRSHERSHMAMAMFNKEDKYSCQYCQFTSPFRHNLDRHVQSHHGHHKPFKCKLCPFKSAYLNRLKSHLQKAHTGEQHMYKCLSCPFSSTTISQLKEHSHRDHGEVLTLPKLRAATQAAHISIKPRLTSTSDQSPPRADDHPYLEPADVRQQLSHYQLASRGHMSSGSTPGGSSGTNHRADGIFTCEYCEFSSGYIQSLRRHYRDRHGGKKLFKCKDCPFFTCDQNTLSMHAEAGHNNNSVNNSTPEELPKDLRCPLCLYHTKNKSNMIDHIVLHREERVAPLEVSRSKLSRHLQGLVFRCHKCTFTCSSDQALQLHLHKHSEIKPFQCQLCYYDSSRKSQLEEHLRLEHKVIRNFELMGRVNLDQLEMIKEPVNSAVEEEEHAVMEMVTKEKNTVENDEDEAMNVHDEEETREMNGVEGLEYNTQDEDPEEGEDLEDTGDSRKLMETEGDKLIRQEVNESPTSSTGTRLTSSSETRPTSSRTRPSSAAGTRLPCEFCGRCFTNSTEWERHVLRHGMVVNSSQIDTSSTSAIEAPSSMCSSVLLESGLDLSINSREEEDFTSASQTSQSQAVNEEQMLDTKNDQQFG